MIPPYILGLWSGDKYWRSSSVGLSNTNLVLLKKFREFFTNENFPDSRVKFSIYMPSTSKAPDLKRIAQIIKNKIQIKPENIKVYKLKKGNNPTFVIYVNSRPLKRKFDSVNLKEVIKNKNDLFKYLGGRFDADGHFDCKKNRLRICYSNEKEIKTDVSIINNITGLRPDIKYYKKANEWVMECCGRTWKKFNKNILNNSFKM